jgi:5-methylcytosine-specific restriction endonuclease McrA
MQKHTKIYLNYFDYGEQDFIPCENCGKAAVDIHHLIYRSHGGSDTIQNLMALCRDCHDRVHNGMDSDRFTDQLKEIHLNKLKL